MSRITAEQVAHIADLARLSLSPDEAVLMQRDLERILDYVDTLREIETEGVEPTCHPNVTATPTRADEPLSSISPEQAVANAPAHSGTAFLVPKVIDEEAP
jgi:aspartyl-tRNA(Asn)/glutamyl-tRNA(Gln) amidotransferase subunit C